MLETQDSLRRENSSQDPSGPKGMVLVSDEEYRKFASKKKHVTIENVEVEVGRAWRISTFGPPKEYKLEEFTVWSFPNRGAWATHTGNYRGNWSPYIPRNLMSKYTMPGDTVLDQMCGSGTTLVECKLLGRNCVGVDVNPEALMVARDRLNFDYNPLDKDIRSETRTYVGDARNLNLVQDETVDLVATHPPYAGIIKYGAKKIPNDLSRLNLTEYIEAMRKVAAESYIDHYFSLTWHFYLLI